MLEVGPGTSIVALQQRVPGLSSYPPTAYTLWRPGFLGWLAGVRVGNKGFVLQKSGLWVWLLIKGFDHWEASTEASHCFTRLAKATSQLRWDLKGLLIS